MEIIEELRLKIEDLKARSQESESRIQNEKLKGEYLFSTGY